MTHRTSRSVRQGRQYARTLDVTPEAEAAIESLLDKLGKWLVNQREWPVLMGAAERQARRKVARLIAYELTTIPKRQFEEFTPNRALRREMMQVMRRAEKSWWKGVEVYDDIRGPEEGPTA
jgi:hypothetical protein